MIDVYHYLKMPKRKSYSAKFKLSVIDIAIEIGNRAAARRSDLNECTVRHWVTNHSAIAVLHPSKKANRGRSAQYPELELLLVDYIPK